MMGEHMLKWIKHYIPGSMENEMLYGIISSSPGYSQDYPKGILNLAAPFSAHGNVDSSPEKTFEHHSV